MTAIPAVAVPIPKPAPLPVRQPYTMINSGHMVMCGTFVPPKREQLIAQLGTAALLMLQGFLQTYAPPHTLTRALPKKKIADGPLLAQSDTVLGRTPGNKQAVGVCGGISNVWGFPQLLPRNPFVAYPFPLYWQNLMFCT